MREGVPSSAQRITQKALSGKASPRDAIKAFCLECVVWDRAAIKECDIKDCPLWMYRPWREE
jgi:hypothetical protein